MKKNSIEAIISEMTLEEKIAQLSSCWVFELQTGSELDHQKMSRRLSQGIGQITRVGGASTLPPKEIARTINRIQRFLVEETRLGIPAIVHEESCAGAMVQGATIFPQAIGLASTFEPSLAEEMAQVIREQLMTIGARQALAPVLDLARDPRWGRVEETFGEDPLLASLFGVAYIRGLQGNCLRKGVAATAKHFIGHSLSHGGRNCAPISIGWYELHEMLLLPFQAAVQDAKVAAVMNAYPQLDGQPIAASRYLLTELLRHKLGFEGVVVSDYHAIEMLHTFHRVAPDMETAAALALRAGIDLELPTTAAYGEALKRAIEAGLCDPTLIDEAVYRVLQLKADLGLFENPYVDEERAAQLFDTPAQRQLARTIAAKSLILLKNDGMLPLPPTIRSIAVIGPNADAPRHMLGDYSYPAAMELLHWLRLGEMERAAEGLPTPTHSVPIVTVLDGIRAVAPPGIRILHAPGCTVQGNDLDGFDEALECARNADVIILVLGDRSGLTPECTTGEFRDSAHLQLPGRQEALARSILDLGKPTAVVLIVGRPYAISEIAERANALLLAWLPGEEGGYAIAEALFGRINPAGRLPISFPRHVGQIPCYYNRPSTDLRSHIHGDYVDERATPLFPFGHGLSYTTFEYSDLSVTPTQARVEDTISITFTVTNTGPVAGEEVAQLYVSDPYAMVPRPVRELKGFVRFALEPGETKRITFGLPVINLAFYTPDLQLVVEPGEIQLAIGRSSEDIRLTATIEVIGNHPTPVPRRGWEFHVSVVPVQPQAETLRG